jgi:hypothetical protein
MVEFTLFAETDLIGLGSSSIPRVMGLFFWGGHVDRFPKEFFAAQHMIIYE